MSYFKKINSIGGWSVAALAALVYILTTEPTASLWDCAEFIATSYKLEIGHPPGNPLFFLIARFFTIFAPSPQSVALAVNIMSCLCSAFTVMFLFWTITHFGRRILHKSLDSLSHSQSWLLVAAGAIGSLGYAFTDTFWFSAVEGEVYAMSSLFTAVVFWAMLKWEECADEPHSDRWLVLIAYLMGLSIGVHLLNLLAIPAIVFIYYLKKNQKITKIGILKATGISVLLLIAVLYVIVPGTISLGAAFDLLFVNTFGLPVNSGIATFAVLLFGAMAGGIWYTYKKGKKTINRVLVFTCVILIGYSCYAAFLIRAVANPPMNSNNPDNPYALKSLINRDQYGNRPLLTGQYYSSPMVGTVEKESYVVDDNNRYMPITNIVDYEYAPGFTYFFPRMYSDRPGHVEAYKAWGNVKGRPENYNGETIMVPSFGENLRFFFNYQLNFMYWRYFLWNFVGRQSDIQSDGGIVDGNWLSGIRFIDELFLGPQSDLPIEKSMNRGRNTYFFLPFLLGLIGLCYQYTRDARGFTVVMWLFFMTGIAIVLYLNMPPNEPRERDYVFAGSFYAFAVWIGLGVIWVQEILQKYLKHRTASIAAAAVVCASVPTILIAQNWDDHNRSHRYVTRDLGRNYMESTLPNSIIIDYGDNDTFPLWYVQEVEGVRPDVRVMNVSYLGGEWYIDEMRIKSNESDPVPFSLPRKKYLGVNASIEVDNIAGAPITIREAMEFIKSDDPRTQKVYNGKKYDFLPASELLLPVNKENALKSGIIKAEDLESVVDTIHIKINARFLQRSDLMILDMLSNFDWLRPIYFTQPLTSDSYSLAEYLQNDGFAYRLIPIRTTPQNRMEMGRIDTETLYDNLMNKFQYGNVKDPRVYIDYTIQHTFRVTMPHNTFARLSRQLAAEGDTLRAEKVLDRALEEMPFGHLDYSYENTLPIISAYYALGKGDKGDALMQEWIDRLQSGIAYYARFGGAKASLVGDEFGRTASLLYELYRSASTYERTKITEPLEQYFHSTGLMKN